MQAAGLGKQMLLSVEPTTKEEGTPNIHAVLLLRHPLLFQVLESQDLGAEKTVAYQLLQTTPVIL
jgi:hypothetical protein